MYIFSTKVEKIVDLYEFGTVKCEKVVESLLTSEWSCRILSVRDGRIVCPFCRRKTGQEVSDETYALRLIVFCRRCRCKLLVDVSGGVVSVNSLIG